MVKKSSKKMPPVKTPAKAPAKTGKPKAAAAEKKVAAEKKLAVKKPVAPKPETKTAPKAALPSSGASAPAKKDAERSFIPSFEDIAALASATAESYQPHLTKAPPAKPGAPAKAPPPAAAKPAAPAAPPPAQPPAAKPATPLSAPGAPAKPAPPPLAKPSIPLQEPYKTPSRQPLKPGSGPALRPPLKPGSGPAPAPARSAVPPLPAQKAPAPSPARPPAPPPREPARASAPTPPPPPPVERPPLKKLAVSGQTTVRDLAEKLGIKVNDLIKKLMAMGVFATINQRLDTDTAVLAAAEFGFDLEISALYGEEQIAKIVASAPESPEDLQPRSPVVTVMGHVDHGKTSLLDAIRTTRVAEKEAGGITQHIGAYRVDAGKGQVVFLDTPGHEAFTAMRARGAKVTDIVILVVSATDGVMPQTVEAIDHAKAAGVPMIVAINKIDLPGANPAKIRQELSNYGLLSEEWGGKTIFVEVSAKKLLNIDKLLEMVLLQAEILELKANPKRPAVGVILEAKMDPKKGTTATVLIQTGTARVGDTFVVGASFGRVRALIDDKGRRQQEAGPATPVEILGIQNIVPQVGDIFNVVSDERQAREIAEKRRLIQREEAFAHQRHVSLIGLKSAKIKELNVVLKADAQGSVEVIKDSIERLSTSEISLKVLHSGVGNVNESDVLLAAASDAIVLAFHVDVEPRAREEAERNGIDLRVYQIIYELIADVKAAMEGLLEPELVDVVSGKLEVRQVFNLSKAGRVAGCMVIDGKAQRSGFARVVRGGKTVAEAKISGLKRFKDDVKEVDKGLECGISLEGVSDFQAGDAVEIFVREKRTRRLESSQ